MPVPDNLTAAPVVPRDSAPAALTITVRLFALLREAAGDDQVVVRVPPATTLHALWPHLVGVAPGLERATRTAAFSAHAVNGVRVRGDVELHDGDEVAYLPPVSGG